MVFQGKRNAQYVFMREKCESDYRHSEAGCEKYARSTIIGIEGIVRDVEKSEMTRIIKSCFTNKDNIKIVSHISVKQSICLFKTSLKIMIQILRLEDLPI